MDRIFARPGFRRLAAIALAGFIRFAPECSAQSPDFHIYLGFGQSNMEGGPKVSGLPAADPRFQVLSVVNCPSLNPPRTMGKWYTADPPLPRCTQGPGIVDWFGRTLVDSLPKNIRIGVLMVTVIGAKIELFDKDAYQAYLNDPATEDWLRNAAKEYGNSPYARLIEMAKVAKKDGVIRGILLHQGESNADDAKWPDKVKKIYGDIMTDLSLDPKDVPLLAGEVVNADVGGTAAGANVQIAKLPGVLPNSYVISSSKLPAGGDRLHFTAEGHKLFGQRYAATLLNIHYKSTGARPGDRPRTGYALGPTRVQVRGKAEADFEIPRRTTVTFRIYAPGGGLIAERAAKEYAAGRHTVGFGPRAIPRGIGILRMEADGFSATRLFAAGD